MTDKLPRILLIDCDDLVTGTDAARPGGAHARHRNGADPTVGGGGDHHAPGRAISARAPRRGREDDDPEPEADPDQGAP
jgi:hypothetical protein